MYYNYLIDFIKKNSGIVINDENSYLLEDRISPILTKFGCHGLSDLAEFLQNNPFGAQHQAVIEAITTNETSFFRDSKFFDGLISYFIPEMINKKRKIKHLKIWSAACSSGQEPYSIAIILQEHFPELYDWKFDILSTDISQQVLNIAKKGAYNYLDVSRGMSDELLSKYFIKKDNQWHVIDKIRNLILFEKMNLLALSPLLEDFDMIFLRNVLIYFDNDDKKSVLNSLSQFLSPDGFLFLGSSEISVNPDWNIQMNRSAGCEYYVRRL